MDNANVVNAAIDLIRKHNAVGQNKMAGVKCPCCDFSRDRWVPAQVVKHAQACEALQAATGKVVS